MMRLAALVLLLLVGSISPAISSDDDPEPPAGGPDFRALRGSWTVTKLLLNGKEMKAPLKTMIYTFSGTKLTMNNGSTTTTFTLKLDKQKKPPVLVLTPEKGAGTRKMSFEVKKDELFLGIAGVKGNNEPPTKFDGSAGPVMVLTREKK